MADKNMSLPIIDIKMANENLKNLKNMMNKSVKAGIYDLEDCETILSSFYSIQKVVENMDLYQKIFLNMQNKN